MVVENVDTVPVSVIDENSLKSEMEDLDSDKEQLKENKEVVSNDVDEDFQGKDMIEAKQEDSGDIVDENNQENVDGQIETSNNSIESEEVEYISEEMEVLEN